MVLQDSSRTRPFAISQWKDVEVLGQNVQSDHVHMVCSIPPKMSVSDFMGLLEGKLAMQIFQSYPDLRQKPYWSNHLAKGYFISTIGLDEDMIRRYVRHQEKEGRKRNRR